MPPIKYNKYVIKGGEKLIIPTGDPPERADAVNLEKYKQLKEELLKKTNLCEKK